DLVAIYVVQELLESFFVAGHPGGLGGIFGHGGWWAVVLALGAGLILATVLRLAYAVVAIARRLAAGRSRPGAPPTVRRPSAVSPVPWPALARAPPRRAPPAPHPPPLLPPPRPRV